MDNETHDYIDWLELMRKEAQDLTHVPMQFQQELTCEYNPQHARGEVIKRKGNVTTVQFK